MSRPATSRRLAALLVPLQLFLAAGWFRAGVEKVIDQDWWLGTSLLAFLDEQRADMLPYFIPFAGHVVEPWAAGIAWLVAGMQLAIGVCLVLNRHVKAALWAGILLNICFTMAGRVNPSAFYLVMEVTLLFALSRPIPIRIAQRRAVLWVLVGLASLPFARTLDPAEVIDDPALMLSFIPVIAAVTTIALATSSTSLVEMAHRITFFGRPVGMLRDHRRNVRGISQRGDEHDELAQSSEYRTHGGRRPEQRGEQRLPA
jgi:hypothetical protein